MNLFFEESGDFKVGTVLSQAGEAYQVEMPSGKRTKVKSRTCCCSTKSRRRPSCWTQAKAIAAEVDLDFLWEVAGQEEFGLPSWAPNISATRRCRRGRRPGAGAAQRADLFLQKRPRTLQGRARAVAARGPGRHRKEEAAGARPGRLCRGTEGGTLPASMQPMVQQLLFKPDKNTIEYKALEAAAADELQTTPQRLMLATGGIASPKTLHMARFLFENFPRGAGFPPVPVPAAPTGAAAGEGGRVLDRRRHHHRDRRRLLGRAAGRRHGARRHPHRRAGPGHPPDDAIDKIARAACRPCICRATRSPCCRTKSSTPSPWPRATTCPALSLYATLNPADWSVLSTTTRAELVPIKSNLRHNDLDALVNEETLESGEGEYPHKAELGLLWKWALQLEAGRMVKREAFGLKPEQNNRVDFNFYVEDDVVSIVRRKRGAPLDKIVAELMIFANSTWGKLLHDSGVPGIYRSQGAGSGGGWAPRCRCAWSRTRRRTRAWAWTSMPGAPRRCAATPTWSTSGRSWPAPSTA
jgi:exoribonuclease-2